MPPSSLPALAVVLSLCAASAGVAQPPPDGPAGPFGPRGRGGPGGPGGPSQPERKVLKQFDADGNGRLEGAEIDAARASLRLGRGGGSPGPRVSPSDVAPAGDAGLFDAGTVRTVFLDFPQAGWEPDLELFHNTDVDLPARMTVDGVAYEGVGVRFRGASSYFMVPAGSKRSLNVSVDHAKEDRRLLGQNTLNFLNANGDPSFMSTFLYSRLAAPHIPAPRANWVRVVVNGESWGLYVNVEQFNKAFLRDRWPQFKGEGARWKVMGSPQGTGGLDDRGDDLAAYRARYEIKSKDRPEDWERLVRLCKTLSNTPIERLEAELAPMLDIEGALWFLALDLCTANSDGYWVRASDYSLYLDPEGKFHLVPHDMNECFRLREGGPPGGGPGGGPGGFGGPPNAGPQEGGPPMRGPGRGMGEQRSLVDLDPLVGQDDPSKPLRSRLLAVPSLRARYLEMVRELAAEMGWSRVGPWVAEARARLEPFVEADTRKLSTLEAFRALTSPEPVQPDASRGGLRAFFERRSAFLAAYVPGGAGPNPGLRP